MRGRGSTAEARWAWQRRVIPAVLGVVFVVGLIFFDFFAHVRTPHAPTFQESARSCCPQISSTFVPARPESVGSPACVDGAARQKHGGHGSGG
ncbi:hypothetical protein [Cellulomonas sp. Leaf334]|uniref:hypothetical protein n=1 Tax=Cellulomonas sp. Leaf334 TaxID=1736339 RepID=UPI00191049DF|nr:hypothetical protein [Cellulomonas sp. Leaf334]